jgi:hypothetical protein
MIHLILLCAALGDITEIGAHQSPGKPMLYFEEGRPGEEILAKKNGDKIVLHVRVNCPRDGVEKYTEETADLTPTEWKSLLEVVEKEKLLEWKPDFTGGQVADWGTTGFRITSDKEYAQKWWKPVKNGKEPAVLAKRLAALAQEKVKGLKLHYLKP